MRAAAVKGIPKRVPLIWQEDGKTARYDKPALPIRRPEKDWRRP